MIPYVFLFLFFLMLCLVLLWHGDWPHHASPRSSKGAVHALVLRLLRPRTMQLLEANGNLTRMLELVALGEEERKLIEQGMALNQFLLSRLADEPTPAGPTPREIHTGKRKALPLLTETIGLVDTTFSLKEMRSPTSELTFGGEEGESPKD
jgi:hypothetical protein